MKKTTSLALLITGIVTLGSATGAFAQTAAPTKNIFVDVNFGGQPQSRDFAMESFPVICDESAFVRTSQAIGGAGLMDVQGGYRVWIEVSAGLGYTTTFTTKSSSQVFASIPHPIFFDTRVESTQTVSDLEHREQTL